MSDPTIERLQEEIVIARQRMIEIVEADPGLPAHRLKLEARGELSDHSVSDGAATLALTRCLDTGALTIRDGDRIYPAESDNSPTPNDAESEAGRVEERLREICALLESDDPLVGIDKLRIRAEAAERREQDLAGKFGGALALLGAITDQAQDRDFVSRRCLADNLVEARRFVEEHDYGK